MTSHLLNYYMYGMSVYTIFIPVYLPLHIDRISKDLSIHRGYTPKFLKGVLSSVPTHGFSSNFAY